MMCFTYTINFCTYPVQLTVYSVSLRCMKQQQVPNVIQ